NDEIAGPHRRADRLRRQRWEKNYTRILYRSLLEFRRIGLAAGLANTVDVEPHQGIGHLAQSINDDVDALGRIQAADIAEPQHVARFAGLRDRPEDGPPRQALPAQHELFARHAVAPQDIADPIAGCDDAINLVRELAEASVRPANQRSEAQGSKRAA